MFTQWFGMDEKPTKYGKYEGREKGTGLRMPVHWRKLQDEPRAGWYFDKGHLHGLHLWEAAERHMDGWRGLAEKGKQ